MGKCKDNFEGTRPARQRGRHDDDTNGDASDASENGRKRRWADDESDD